MKKLKWLLRPAPPPPWGGVWCDITCHTYHNHHQMVHYVPLNSEIPTFQVSLIQDTQLIVCDTTTEQWSEET